MNIRLRRLFIFTTIIILAGFASRYLIHATEHGLTDASRNKSSQADQLNAIRFVITPRGLEPADMSITPGRYWVAIDNNLDFKENSLNIDRIGGPRIKSGKTFQGQRKFRGFVDFSPGEYLVSESSRPGLQSKITVSAQK